MKADISGSRNGQLWPKRGEVMELPDDEAADLCAAGLAEPVAKKDADVETAVPADTSEKRQEPKPEQQPEKASPVTTESAPAAAKKTAARKTAAKKAAPAAAKPQTDSK
jgi:hypothetical protein